MTENESGMPHHDDERRSCIKDYLKRAQAACDSGDAVLGMYLYLAAFEEASTAKGAPNEDALTGLKQAWALACTHKERSLAEYIFERLEPYLSSDEITICAEALHGLALDKLEEFGLSRDDLEEMAQAISDDLLDGDGSVLRVERIVTGRLPHAPRALPAAEEPEAEAPAEDGILAEASKAVLGADRSDQAPPDYSSIAGYINAIKAMRDIGVGMGITGTDVTKNVADMVLADDNFATIVSAVGEGRRIYDNIRKAIQFLLSSNIAEVIAVFVATMIGFVILEPVHLLWINLITDCFPALALGMEKTEPGIMGRKPREASDGIFAGGMGVDVVFQGVVISLFTLISYFIGVSHQFGTVDLGFIASHPEAGVEGMTMAFLTLSMVEMFHSFNMRSRRQSIFKLGNHNRWLWGSFALSLVLTFVVIEVPPVAQVFGFAELDAPNYLMAMGLAFLIIPIMELYKLCWRVRDNAA